MIKIRFETQTNKTFEQFQQDLNRAIDGSFAAAITTRKWSNQTLHTAAPATQGFVRFDSGIVQAEVLILLLAAPMKLLILSETHRILSKASGGPVSSFE